MTPVAGPGRRRGGFTLVEALVALTISSILIVLVSNVFLVQNEYYAYLLQRSRVQDASRSVADFLSGELKSLVPGSVTVADSLRLVVRLPVALGAICDISSDDLNIHMHRLADMDASAVDGVAWRDPSDGDWTFYDVPWAGVAVSDSPLDCAGRGTDTTGISDEFVEFSNVASSVPAIQVGDVILAFDLMEYRFKESVLEPGTRGLFRGAQGDTLTEFATGLADDAHFAYRSGDTTHVSSVSTQLDLIDGIRVFASSVARADNVNRSEDDFELVVDIRLRNSN